MKNNKHIMILPTDNCISWAMTINGKMYGGYANIKSKEKRAKDFNGVRGVSRGHADVVDEVKEKIKFLSETCNRTYLEKADLSRQCSLCGGSAAPHEHPIICESCEEKEWIRTHKNEI